MLYRRLQGRCDGIQRREKGPDRRQGRCQQHHGKHHLPAAGGKGSSHSFRGADQRQGNSCKGCEDTAS